MLAVAVPVASAEEPPTKQQIIDRSAGICRDMLEAAAPHLERAREAADRDKLERFIRESRRAIDAVRQVEPDLKDLVPPTGGRIYRRFVRHGRAGLDRLDAALDALEQRRVRLAKERRRSALEHFERARRAARRYGLRRSCIRLLS